ncbi:hypothetical protein EGW08_001260, partial [Elysia chlorotica]
WQRLRTPLNRHLTKVDSAEHYLDSQNSVAEEFAKILSSGPRSAKEIQDWFFKYSTECVGLVCLNTRLGLMDPQVPVDSAALVFLEDSKNIFLQIANVLNGKSIMHDYYLNKTYREYERSNSFVRSYIKSRLRRAKTNLDRQSNPKRDDREKPTGVINKRTCFRLPRRRKHDDDTLRCWHGVATNLQTFCYELASNPEKQEKLYEEIVAVLGKNGPVTREKLRRMPYLKACLKESFRMRYPYLTGPARLLPNDAVIRGFRIPAKTQILPCNSYTCQTIFPDADKFLPERWLRSETDRKLSHEIPRLACLPFGFGARNCIGRRFAEQQIFLAVIKTVQKCRIKLRPGSSDVVFRYSIFIEPAEPIKFEFEPREHQKAMEEI